MAQPTPSSLQRRASSPGWLAFIAAALAVSATAYLATRLISPDINASLFGARAASALTLKSWLANGVLALAALQLYSALWIYGRMPWRQPQWLARAHRISGRAAIVLSLPIAYHCLFAYGFRALDARTAMHSIAGCLLYGAFAAKLVAVRSRRLPAWALPLTGAAIATTIALLWYSSALWYFNGFDAPGLTPSVTTGSTKHIAYPHGGTVRHGY